MISTEIPQINRFQSLSNSYQRFNSITKQFCLSCLRIPPPYTHSHNRTAHVPKSTQETDYLSDQNRSVANTKKKVYMFTTFLSAKHSRDRRSQNRPMPNTIYCVARPQFTPDFPFFVVACGFLCSAPRV